MNAYLFVDANTAELLAMQAECALGPQKVAIRGYEAYFVEQWVCSREVNTVVASYTGNTSDVVIANTVFLPASADDFGPGSRQIFDSLSAMHLLPKETENGLMLVTNLSSLPSSWTLIPMPPQTQFCRAMRLFIVNEDLRRLQCMGRLSVALEKPNSTAEAKFRSMYMVHLDVPIDFAVRELVTMVQMALYFSGLLDGAFVDGLLCDMTLAKARDWWAKFGLRYFDVPAVSDPQYCVTTAAALIGWFVSMRNRLSALNYKPPKDPFDANQLSVCIKQFQKTEKLARTAHLDEKTSLKLCELSANRLRTPQSDLLIQVKSNRANFKSGSTDINLMALLAKNAKGGRAQYLWQGRGHPYEPAAEPHSGEDVHCQFTGIPLHALRADDRTLVQNKRGLVHRFRAKSRASDLRRAQDSELNLPVSFSTTSLDTAPPLPTLSAPLLPSAPSLPLPSLSASALPTSTDKTPHEDPETQDELTRRLVGDLSIRTRDDLAVTRHSQLTRPMRPRSHSVSLVESVVSPTQKPVSSARLHLLFREARELQDQVYQRLNTDAKRCEELNHELERRNSEVNIEYRQTESMKFQVHATNRKEYAVKVRMHELEALMSKVDYEYDVVGSKVKEVEMAVADFGAKVDILEKQFNRLRRTPTNWWRTLFGY